MTEDKDAEVGEHAVGELHVLLHKAQILPVHQVEAIAEEFQVDALLAKATPHRRKIYTAVAEYFGHVAKERRRKARDAGEEDGDSGIGGAVRAIIDNLDDD